MLVAATVGLSAPLWAPPLLAGTEAFQVEKVGVTGVRYCQPQELLGRAGVAPDASVWDDPSEWEERVRGHPLVRDARVVRVGRHQLEIQVDEIRPVALAATPELMPVDRRGRVLPLDPARAELDLPILGSRAEVEDDRVVDEETRTLLRILVRLREAESGFVTQASEFQRLDGGGVVVWMSPDAAGAARILLPEDRPVLALSRVQVALGQHGPEPVAAADARFEEQVVLTVDEVDA